MYVFLVLKKGLNGSVGLMDRSWGFMVSFGPGTKESQGGEFKILTGEVPVNLLNRSKGSFATTLETLAFQQKTAHVTLKRSLPPRVGI